MRMSTEDNKAVVRRFYEEVMNQKKRAVLDEVFDLNVVDHFAPPGTPGGLEGARQTLGMFLSAFPDLHFTVEDLIAEGDKVVARATMSGTFFFFQAEDGIRDLYVTGVQTCALPI